MHESATQVSPSPGTTWVLVAALLVVFLRMGLGLVITGLGRAKNAAHAVSMNLMSFALSVLGFFVCGYAFMCGADDQPIAGPGIVGRLPSQGHFVSFTPAGHSFPVLSIHGFFLAGRGDSDSTVWFFLMAALAATAAVIPTGAISERWKFSSFCAMSVLMGTVIYPIFGNWVWGGGWLARLGMNGGLGHGAVDYAGSSVVHLLGGIVAWVGAYSLGPRIGKYDTRGRPKPMFGHNLPMVFAGTGIAAFGWYGANIAATVTGNDGRAGLVAVNTVLASTAGAVTACSYMWKRYGKPDPTLMCSGMLAGLVAVSGCCAFVAFWAALLVGAVAGLLCCWGVVYLEKKRIDDSAGVISIHGIAGLWGTLALGLFADGKFGVGYNGVTTERGVTGLFYGDPAQLLAQIILIFACFAWAGLIGALAFKLVGRWCGGNRVTTPVEISGLDINEMGVPAYPEFITSFDARNEPTEIPQLRRDMQHK